MARPCQCGGEAQLESYDVPMRPSVWFMRCRSCQRMSRATATEDEAKTIWAAEGPMDEEAA